MRERAVARSQTRTKLTRGPWAAASWADDVACLFLAFAFVAPGSCVFSGSDGAPRAVIVAQALEK